MSLTLARGTADGAVIRIRKACDAIISNTNIDLFNA